MSIGSSQVRAQTGPFRRCVVVALCSPPASQWVHGCSGTSWVTRGIRGHPCTSTGEAVQAAEPCAASAAFLSSVCRWERSRLDPWGILLPGLRTGQSTAPRRLVLQLIYLCVQITAEESEDEPPSREERVDTWLSAQDGAEGNSKRTATEEAEGDRQRDGEEAEQPDQTVTEPQRECS